MMSKRPLHNFKKPARKGSSNHLQTKDSSWEPVQEWYQGHVGEEGHYYHQHIILPNVLRFLKQARKVLDIGCGQGVLARKLPKPMGYLGIDLSPSLIAKAKQLQPERKERFLLQDACQSFSLNERDFSHSVLILSLQNMLQPKIALTNIQHHLEARGTLLIVLNHPCFRIPRQSGWQIDPEKKLQSRRIDRYMSSLEIPIMAHPSQGDQSSSSLTFHHPLAFYSQILMETGFVIESLEEWCSDKTSHGANARMENRARKEFPLFLVINARKKSDI